MVDGIGDDFKDGGGDSWVHEFSWPNYIEKES